jgi:hypothetical protein
MFKDANRRSVYTAARQFKDSVMNVCTCNIRWNHIYLITIHAATGRYFCDNV